MIAQAVERVWSGGSSGTPGQDYAVAPLLLPPYPSQYCFPERRQIKINLNSSMESDTSGNACGALNYMFRALCMLCTLVTKYLCIYLFYSGATTNTTETETTKQHPAEGNNYIYKEGPSGTYTCQPSIPCRFQR